LHQRAIPRERQLYALSHALEVEPKELLALDPPVQGGKAASALVGVVRAQDQGDGTVALEIVQRLPWETALKVLRVLKAPADDDAGD
jgi:hypothetical protein